MKSFMGSIILRSRAILGRAPLGVKVPPPSAAFLGLKHIWDVGLNNIWGEARNVDNLVPILAKFLYFGIF